MSGVTKDSKCRSGWYGGHVPKDEEYERTVCIYCKKSLVRYGLFGRYQLDKTKKAVKA